MSVETNASATRTDFATYFADVDIPTVGRTVASFVVSFLVGFGLTYVADFVASVLMLSTFVLTGSSFIAFTVWFLVWAVALIASIYAGAAVGRYVLERRIDEDAKKLRAKSLELWSKAKAKFSRDDVEVDAVILH